MSRWADRLRPGIARQVGERVERYMRTVREPAPHFVAMVAD